MVAPLLAAGHMEAALSPSQKGWRAKHWKPLTYAYMATLMCCRYVHGDIKPENFLMGHPDSPNAKELYLVDLGLSRRYKAPNGEHFPYRQIPTDFR